MGWPVKTHPAHSTGLESKKTSSDGENFSLDFSFYRTSLIAMLRPKPNDQPALSRDILRSPLRLPDWIGEPPCDTFGLRRSASGESPPHIGVTFFIHHTSPVCPAHKKGNLNTRHRYQRMGWCYHPVVAAANSFGNR